MRYNYFLLLFCFVCISYSQQGSNIDLDEVVNSAKIIPRIQINGMLYAFRERDTLIKKLLRSNFWDRFTEFNFALEDYETGKPYSFQSKGPLRIFINNNELTRRHVFKTFASIRELNSKIEKVEIRTDLEKKNIETFRTNFITTTEMVIGGQTLSEEITTETETDSKVYPVTHVKITANYDSQTLFNRIRKKEKKLDQKLEQSGSIAFDQKLLQSESISLEGVEVVQDYSKDGVIYSPKYVDGQITFEENKELTRLAIKGEQYKKMGYNEWGIDVNATTWFSALRGIIGGKASGGPSQDGLPILYNVVTLGASPMPLWVIDGTQLLEPPKALQSILPEIRKVEILKYQDAASYGARGAAGVIEITTISGMTKVLNKNKSFNVKGKKNKELMIKYQKLESQFKVRMEQLKTQRKYAYENDNIIRMDSFQKLLDNTLSKSYLYTANFALTYSKYEIAPYLAYTKISDANISLLDSIGKTLSPKVKKSKYGKKLLDLVELKKEKKLNDSN